MKTMHLLRGTPQARCLPNSATLELLLYHYWSGETYSWTDSETEIKARTFLFKEQLLQGEGTDVEITERGRVHVESLINAPLPVLKWVAA